MGDPGGPLRRLATRATVQTVAFLVLLVFLLLAPAGTLLFWQAWIYVGIFVVATASLTMYLLWRDPGLLERRLALGERGEPDPRQGRVLQLSGAAFFAMLLVAGLDVRFGWSRVPFPAVMAADAVVTLGFLLVFFVFRENGFTSAVVEVAAGQRVVATGPYRVVRHPMYAAALLVLVASPVALGSWWAEAPVPVVAAGIVLRLLEEERLLAERLEGYRAYMASARYRLVPRVW